jgi:D-alanine-D-alanine ligase
VKPPARVLILYDEAALRAESADQADALVQARTVREALESLGYECHEAGVGLDLKALTETLSCLRPSFVFNLVESLNSKGRLIAVVPMLLETIGIPYTGSPADAVYLTSNKLLTKMTLISRGITAPPLITPVDLEGDRKVPVIIKSVWEHASVGLDGDSILEEADPADLERELSKRSGIFGGQGFAELYIEGREFNLSLIADSKGPRVLPPAEIIFRDYPPTKRRVVGYRAKWEENSFEYANTPRSFSFPIEDQDLVGRLSSIARDCWRIFGLRGYARVDFRVDKDSTPWVLEINTNPCLSPDAGFMAAAAEAGLDARAVIEAIVEDVG